MHPAAFQAALLLSLVGGLCGAGAPPVQPVLPINKDALARIQSLGANEAARVGNATVKGEFNEVAKRFELPRTGPRGRDYSIKMVWAPERKRALFCGANHAVPHRLNDVWEFDLAAMSWVMLYAPDNARDYLGLGKDFSDVEFKEGIFITKRGGPGIIAHTWWGLTYDPEQRAMLFLNTWVTEQKKAAQQLGGDPTQLYAGPPLWAFSPATRTWKMLKTAAPSPRSIFGGMLEYVPELRGTIWHANNWQTRSTWLYQAPSNRWSDLKSNDAGPAFEKEAAEPEQVGYYDPVRRLIIAHRHKSTHHFDPLKNAWRRTVNADKDSDAVPWGHDAFSPMYYDAASGHGLLVEFKTHALWSYDPDHARWTRLKPTGDPMPKGSKLLAYADPVHNVLVVLHDTAVWAYRYRIP